MLNNRSAWVTSLWAGRSSYSAHVPTDGGRRCSQGHRTRCRQWIIHRGGRSVLQPATKHPRRRRAKPLSRNFHMSMRTASPHDRHLSTARGSSEAAACNFFVAHIVSTSQPSAKVVVVRQKLVSPRSPPVMQNKQCYSQCK